MRRPSGIDSLVGVVAPEVLLDALRASARLRDLGIPHALVGGLAVGLYGHVRATRDVDFLVGSQAFARQSPLLIYRDELHDLVRVGVIDFLAVPPGHEDLEALLAVPSQGELPVVPLSVLVMMKLQAGRPQDRADIAALLDSDEDVDEVFRYLHQHAPELVGLLQELTAVVR